MENKVIAEGKTTNEAIENGLKILKVSKDKVDIKIMENEEKRSFFSILAPRVVKVELTLKENAKNHEQKRNNPSLDEIKIAKQDIKQFLDRFLKQVFIQDAKYEIEEENETIFVNITGENMNTLIGYRGESLNALQVILTSIANKKSSQKIRIILDIQGYRKKREKALEELAEKISKTVMKTGKSVTLEPMSSYERKIIHSKLQNHDKVKTFSKGEEPYRKVIIALK